MSIDMVQIARRVLEEAGFEPDGPHEIMPLGNRDPGAGALDLRELPWSSIDNARVDGPRSDRVSPSSSPTATIRVLLGIADVDALVPKGSPIDAHAGDEHDVALHRRRTRSRCCPRRCRRERTSLLEGGERLAMVTEMHRRARRHGRRRARRDLPRAREEPREARLRGRRRVARGRRSPQAPHGPGARRAAPAAGRGGAAAAQAAASSTARSSSRRSRRAPSRRTARSSTSSCTHKNRARELIEDLMIAANGATARFLEQRGCSSIRRVVRAPKRWDRIVELARDARRRAARRARRARARATSSRAQRRTRPDAVRRSLAVDREAARPGRVRAAARRPIPISGHFGLAVDDYAHSTAPNRRYRRPRHAAPAQGAPRAGSRAPYTDDELRAIAAHCTERENAARKVERTMRKVAAAALLCAADRRDVRRDRHRRDAARARSCGCSARRPRAASSRASRASTSATRSASSSSRPSRQGFIDFAALP